jgi:cytochrome oxidase Cu insertion factor (SCO1/SenC/PrrC family)
MMTTSGPGLLVLGGMFVLAMAAAASGAGPAGGEELKPGDPAPNFTLPASDGKTYTLADLEGKTVVLAWFPKAFTGG